MGRQTPEERELEKKRAELATLEGELADRELEFATLKNELRAFEVHYLRTVGKLYAELDDLDAQIAERLAREHPHERSLGDQAERTRAKAAESARATSTDAEAIEPHHFKPGDDLKKLYREIARQIHPDLATDEANRARRNRMMADANKAYTAGDEARLRSILEEWHSSPEAIDGDGVAAELVRTIRKIHQVGRRLSQIEEEMAALRSSSIHGLMMAVDAATAQSRDLFADMIEELTAQIEVARAQLSTLTSRHG